MASGRARCRRSCRRASRRRSRARRSAGASRAPLLAAQLYEESHFNPFARSAAGALGIAQFMPATAAGYGLGDPFDADRAIDAQAHLMRDLLRSFAAVPLALAAYNAGSARVRACGCVPPIPGTQSYVADILGLLHGAGDPSGEDAGAWRYALCDEPRPPCGRTARSLPTSRVATTTTARRSGRRADEGVPRVGCGRSPTSDWISVDDGGGVVFVVGLRMAPAHRAGER
jgi:hypothetical protein